MLTHVIKKVKNFAHFTMIWLKRLVVFAVLFGLVIYASYYTPIFSSVGLMVLNHLPVPHVNSDVDVTNIEPTAYIVLGGGLTEATESTSRISDSNLVNDNTLNNNANQSGIVLNTFSLERVQTAKIAYTTNPMPIVLTGVESPWMRDWLQANGVANLVLETASMNTCENARFTAKRLALPHAYLITDAYHMARARRQFALNGIATMPLPAPLPTPKNWQDITANMMHSRRALYEMVAYARDIFRPQPNCREADEVSIETLMTSRQQENLKTF